MRRNPGWTGFSRTTLVVAPIVNGAGILFWIELAPGVLMPAFDGLLQRLGFAGTLIWTFLAALRLRRG